MRVTARIALGYGILMALLLLMAVVQMVSVNQMRTLGDDQARDSLQTALASLLLLEERDLIERNVEVFFNQSDSSVRSELELHRDNFSRALQELRGSAVSESEQREIARLAEFWSQFVAALAQETAGSAGGLRKALPHRLEEHLARLQTQTRTLYGVSVSAVRAQALQARTVGRQLARISWVIAVTAVVLAGLAVILITRSISIPLANLTQGTRAIVERKTYVRLDTSANDELAQIAKDFNTLVDRMRDGPAGG